ncbi:MAG: hypothetical protein ABEK59_07430 [Halobacteria archaeon]
MIDAKVVKTQQPLYELASRFGFDFRKGSGNLCPFCGKHKLQVNDYYYYCFMAGCKGKRKGGDIYELLKDTGKAQDFRDAFNQVKTALGVKEQRQRYAQKLSNRADVLEEAFLRYNRNAGQQAYNYLLDRGLRRSLEAIPIGCADREDFLKPVLSSQQLEQAGILSARGRELFYDHVIFPIYNARGRLAHLQGRGLESNQRWINTKGEEGLTISHFLFNQDKASAPDLYLTEGISDGMTLIELLGPERVTSCIGVSPKLEANLPFFATKQSLTAVFDNDRFEEGLPEAGLLKSWASILEKLLTLKTYLPDLAVYCLTPPDKPRVTDVNDWFLSGELDRTKLDPVPLWEFLFQEFPEDPRFHGQLVAYLTQTEDPELKQRFEQNLQTRSSLVDYLQELVEKQVFHVMR